MENDILIGRKEVQEIFKCSRSKAYQIIRGLNDTLIKNGVPKESIHSGKISKSFLCKALKISI